MTQQKRTFVILESPFAGDSAEKLTRNREYALQALYDSLVNHYEAPFASHLLYPQILDDTVPYERLQGIEAGLCIGEHAERTVVYVDYGISDGMHYGIERAYSESRPVEYRTIL